MIEHELLAAAAERCQGLSNKANKTCKECGAWDMGYVVKDAVWLEVEPAINSGFLCLSCFERLLPRELTIEDFIPWPINYTLFFGYLMGKTAAAAQEPDQ